MLPGAVDHRPTVLERFKGPGNVLAEGVGPSWMRLLGDADRRAAWHCVNAPYPCMGLPSSVGL